MKEKIIQTFQEKIFVPNKDDPTYEVRKEYFENKTEEQLLNLLKKEKIREKENLRT